MRKKVRKGNLSKIFHTQKDKYWVFSLKYRSWVLTFMYVYVCFGRVGVAVSLIKLEKRHPLMGKEVLRNIGKGKKRNKKRGTEYM